MLRYSRKRKPGKSRLEDRVCIHIDKLKCYVNALRCARAFRATEMIYAGVTAAKQLLRADVLSREDQTPRDYASQHSSATPTAPAHYQSWTSFLGGRNNKKKRIPQTRGGLSI